MTRSSFRLLTILAIAIGGCGQSDRPAPAPVKRESKGQPLGEDALTDAANWQRYTSADGVCSAEFLEPPQNETTTTKGVGLARLTLTLHGPDITYRLSSVDILPEGPPFTDEERFDHGRDGLISQGGKFISERTIAQNGVPGRYLEFEKDKYLLRLKMFKSGARLYQIMAVVPRDSKDDDGPKRFLSSIRFEKGKD